MPRKRDHRPSDIAQFCKRLAEASALTGISVESLCQYLFKDARLPGRAERQHKRMAMRRAKLEKYITDHSTKGRVAAPDGAKHG